MLVAVDDKIIAWYPQTLSVVGIREVVNRFEHLLRKDGEGNPRLGLKKDGDDIKMTIWLDRPDSLDEGIIMKYETGSFLFGDELKKAGCHSVVVGIAEFHQIA